MCNLKNMKYWDKVRVTSWFYEWFTWYIVWQWLSDNSFILSDVLSLKPETFTGVISLECLELIK